MQAKKSEPLAVLSVMLEWALQPKARIPPTFYDEAFLFSLCPYIMKGLVGYGLTGYGHVVYFQRIEQRFGPCQRIRQKKCEAVMIGGPSVSNRNFLPRRMRKHFPWRSDRVLKPDRKLKSGF